MFRTFIEMVRALGGEHEQRVEFIEIGSSFDGGAMLGRLQARRDVHRGRRERTIAWRRTPLLMRHGDQFHVGMIERALRATTSDECLAIGSPTLDGEAKFFHQLPPDRLLEHTWMSMRSERGLGCTYASVSMILACVPEKFQNGHQE